MEKNVELKNFTTFKIGGPARYFFRVQNIEQAREALGFARENGMPLFVLGGGSNLLINDEGFSGVVIKNEISGVSYTEEDGIVKVTAGAGEPWDAFVETVVDKGLYGVENLSGIPGTVGGAAVQNIGAYGAEVKDTIVSVEALDAVTGEAKKFSNADCRFAYRDSFFKSREGKRYVITSVTFRLKKNDAFNTGYKDLKNYFASRGEAAQTPASVRAAVLEIRRGKFPDLKTTGTAGSFFKNPIIPQSQYNELKKRFPNLPGFFLTRFDLKSGERSNLVKVPLAWILDNILHLKGYMNGAIGLHEAQPLVVVNSGGSTSEDVCRLAADVARKVKDATGIELEWEVERL